MTDVTSGEQAQTFAERTRLAASEELTALSARRTSIEGQIEGLRIELESVSKQTHEAQVVLDALDGKLVHTDDATRHDEPRADWHEPVPDAPLRAKAEDYVVAREGGFTLTDLTNALASEFPDERIAPHIADAILSALLNDDLIMVDHGASTSAQVVYVAVTPPEPPTPPTEELESARSEEGGVQPISDSESEDSDEGKTPQAGGPERRNGLGTDTGERRRSTDTAEAVLPAASGADTRKVIDDSVLEHLAEHPRCRREDIMSALSLTDIAAAQSLARLVKAGELKVVAENPSRWSLVDEPPPKPVESPNGATAVAAQPQQYLSLEIVRDHARMYEQEHGTPWKKPELAEFMAAKLGREVKPASIQDYVKELGEKGVLERTGGKRGPGVRYQYVKPNGSGPASRPRHDHPRQTPKGAKVEAGRGTAVPHTGRAKGRADTSGKNKKAQSLGFRVKTSRGDRKRAG